MVPYAFILERNAGFFFLFPFVPFVHCRAVSDSTSIQGVRLKETVGERHCFWQEAMLAELVVYLDPPSWPWAGHLTWASEGFSQYRAAGGLRWAILIPKEKRSLVISQNECCDRLTRNSSTQNRKFLTSLCEFSLVFESEANTGKVTLVPPVLPALALGAKQWLFQIFISNPVCRLCVFPLLGGRLSRGQDAKGSFVFITSCFLW